MAKEIDFTNKIRNYITIAILIISIAGTIGALASTSTRIRGGVEGNSIKLLDHESRMRKIEKFSTESRVTMNHIKEKVDELKTSQIQMVQLQLEVLKKLEKL